jgi:hypothetical protein
LSPLTAQLAQEAAEKIVEWVVDTDAIDRTDQHEMSISNQFQEDSRA